jgi:hypothetical protein
MPNWKPERDGTYLFSFSPTRDDFSEVKVGKGWSLNPEHAREGNEFACCFTDAASTQEGALLEEDGAWLFSAPFEFTSGTRYEAGLKYRLIGDADGDVPWLTLRLGRGQDPSEQDQRLVQLSIANTATGTISIPFEVPANGVYFFSIQGRPGKGVVALIENLAGIEGASTDFWDDSRVGP